MDLKAFGRLLVALLRESARFEAKKELSRKAPHTGIHRDDYISVYKHEENFLYQRMSPITNPPTILATSWMKDLTS